MSALIEEARAKVNLTLRVVGRRVDGYHDIESVVAFADCADRLTLEPGSALKLTMTGPRAQDCGDTDENLVLKTTRLLGERIANLRSGEFTLDKQLPVAAGVGGGSADAAAALRLLAQANKIDIDDPRVIEVAQLTGADVPVCVPSRSCVMTGVGETLLPLILPRLPCVLVNPRVPVATRDVFAELGLSNGELNVGVSDVIEAIVWPDNDASADDWIGMLSDGTNDLEAPAIRVQPAIGAVLSVLGEVEGARLTRMSGSGATCFAIFDNDADARSAAQKIRIDYPHWWVHAGALG